MMSINDDIHEMAYNMSLNISSIEKAAMMFGQRAGSEARRT